MTVRVSVRVDKIYRLQASLSAKSQEAVKSAAFITRDFASSISPVRTGALQASWYVSGPGNDTTYPEASGAAAAANPRAIILEEAKAAQVDPQMGQLRNTLGMFSNPEAIVSSAVNYSVYLEEGTKYMAPRPILRPASEAGRAALLSSMPKVAD